MYQKQLNSNNVVLAHAGFLQAMLFSVSFRLSNLYGNSVEIPEITLRLRIYLSD